MICRLASCEDRKGLAGVSPDRHGGLCALGVIAAASLGYSRIVPETNAAPYPEYAPAVSNADILEFPS